MADEPGGTGIALGTRNMCLLDFSSTGAHLEAHDTHTAQGAEPNVRAGVVISAAQTWLGGGSTYVERELPEPAEIREQKALPVDGGPQ